MPYLVGESKVDLVDRTLVAREATIQMLHHNLLKAQNRMKQAADGNITDMEFNLGDWIYLKLQPYRQMSLEWRTNQKLVAKFYSPYRVIARVGQVAYTLDLPVGSAIHLIVHVSLLKKTLWIPS